MYDLDELHGVRDGPEQKAFTLKTLELLGISF